jgi:acetate---CoA ligase (ADP-forming)
MEEKQKLSHLLRPESIAVIGASGTKGKVGHMIAKNVLAHSFEGDVYFINPRRKKILGKKVYPSVTEIGTNIDCAIVVVPAEYVHEVIEDSARFCKNFVVISAGFGESGTVGHNRESRLRLLADTHGINILGPNCLGFLIPSLGLNASFAEGLPKKGHVALISQSGALAVAMMDKAEEDHIGFSAVVSIGNKMQIGAADLVEYFVDDPNTKVIAMYLEGVIRGAHFLRTLAKAHKNGKKVIVLKSGRTEQAQQAIALHTGSLAGSDDVFSAALEKVGAIRAQSMDELFALVLFAAHTNGTYEKTVNIGIVTNAGGPGVLATDVIAEFPQITMSTFSKKTKNALKKTLPDAASVHNPVDLLGDADITRYEQSIKTVLADEHVDIVLVLLTPQDQTPVDAVAKLLIDLQKKTVKKIIASFIGGVRVSDAIAHLRENDVLHFTTPRSACRAIAEFVWNKKVYSLQEKNVDTARRKKMRMIIDRSYEQNGLYFEDAAEIADLYNIQTVPFFDITDGLSANSRITYPCVAKIDNPRIVHKTDRGGVIAPIRTLVELDRARKHLLKTFQEKNSRVIVQSLLPVKMELIIGMQRDPIFGTVILAGLGGIYTEIFHVVDHYVAPLTLSEIKNILTNRVLAFLFDGVRGEECYNKDAIARVIYAIAQIARENSEIVAIDINPLFIYNNDTADVAVDFKIII